MNTNQTREKLRAAYRTGAPAEFRTALAEHERAIRAAELRQAEAALRAEHPHTSSGARAWLTVRAARIEEGKA